MAAIAGVPVELGGAFRIARHGTSARVEGRQVVTAARVARVARLVVTCGGLRLVAAGVPVVHRQPEAAAGVAGFAGARQLLVRAHDARQKGAQREHRHNPPRSRHELIVQQIARRE